MQVCSSCKGSSRGVPRHEISPELELPGFYADGRHGDIIISAPGSPAGGRSATPLAARSEGNETSASRIIERLGGGGPGGQSAVRGFFIGIALGILLALLCCCWYPCVHMRRAEQRAAARRLLRAARARRRGQRREVVQDNPAMEAAPTEAHTEGTTATTMTTAERPLATH
ncbi:hypothetical protein NLG97_g8338 [Lecanicillium saksenae]|uniref:Uncharacterized protein n=1 Tax=Lecanicillium saksenae TaxID=468837 RepID=A0ACC1QKY1_9HYPO|nr:hypothetical protein NLG97_g8338 [Lecanicillium saksenae]